MGNLVQEWGGSVERGRTVCQWVCGVKEEEKERKISINCN